MLRGACAALLLGSGCGWAHAHAAFGDASSIWSGVMHVLTSPLSLASIVGVALIGAGVRDPWPPAVGGLAACAAAVGALFAASAPLWLAPALVAMIGLAAVRGPHTGPVGVAFLSLYAGAAAGLGAELDQAAARTVLGIAAATGVALVLALVWTEELGKVRVVQPVLPMAKRIAGSWIAAMALLLGALALKASAA